MDPVRIVEIEHIMDNSKTMEKIDHRISKIEDKITSQELVITKWVNYLYGLFTVVVTCCGIFLWSGLRLLDGNDKMNDVQNEHITEISKSQLKTEDSVEQLQKEFVTLKDMSKSTIN